MTIGSDELDVDDFTSDLAGYQVSRIGDAVGGGAFFRPGWGYSLQPTNFSLLTPLAGWTLTPTPYTVWTAARRLRYG